MAISLHELIGRLFNTHVAGDRDEERIVFPVPDQSSSELLESVDDAVSQPISHSLGAEIDQQRDGEFSHSEILDAVRYFPAAALALFVLSLDVQGEGGKFPKVIKDRGNVHGLREWPNGIVTGAAGGYKGKVFRNEGFDILSKAGESQIIYRSDDGTRYTDTPDIPVEQARKHDPRDFYKLFVKHLGNDDYQRAEALLQNLLKVNRKGAVEYIRKVYEKNPTRIDPGLAEGMRLYLENDVDGARAVLLKLPGQEMPQVVLAHARVFEVEAKSKDVKEEFRMLSSASSHLTYALYRLPEGSPDKAWATSRKEALDKARYKK